MISVRDLKFHDQIQERSSVSSRVRDAVKRMFGKSDETGSFKSYSERPQSPHLNTQDFSYHEPKLNSVAIQSSPERKQVVSFQESERG